MDSWTEDLRRSNPTCELVDQQMGEYPVRRFDELIATSVVWLDGCFECGRIG